MGETEHGKLASLRLSGFANYDNRQLTKLAWSTTAFTTTMLAAFLIARARAPPQAGPMDFAPVFVLTRTLFAGLVFAGFIGTLVYPIRYGERWLDERFPRYTADNLRFEYRVVDDVLASAAQAIKWGIELGAIYIFISLAVLATVIYSSYAEAGYASTPRGSI